MSPAELVARYRQYAAKCVNVAQGQENASEKLLLLEMAQAWLDLAKQVEKNEFLFVVNETPDPPRSEGAG